MSTGWSGRSIGRQSPHRKISSDNLYNQLLIILLNQFYPPDIAPTGVKLHDIAKCLVGHGHDVVVITSKGTYGGSKSFETDFIDKVRIIRLPAFNFGRRTYFGKILDYASFYLILFFKLWTFRPKPDAVVALTTPPYLGILTALLFGRHSDNLDHSNSQISPGSQNHTRVVQWIMDLYPDVMKEHGMLGQSSLIYRSLEKINRAMFMRSHAILALGPSMIDRISKYVECPLSKKQSNKGNDHENFATVEKRPNMQWVPLWGDSDLKPLSNSERHELRSKYGWKEDDCVLMHAGNLGFGVNTDEFLEAATRLGPSGPMWAFFGGGKRWAALQQFAETHKEVRIELYDYAPKAILGAADVHLVSLKSSWTGIGVPSKIQNIFSIGKPALFIGNMQCEIAQWILESGGGWVVREDDIDGLLSAIDAANNPEERARRGHAAYAFAEEYFNRAKNCERIARFILQN